MNRNSEIASAVGRALAMSAAATAAVHSTPAAAQDQAADESTQIVTVTGSRIRRVDLETAAPVFVLDQAQIQNSGVSTIGDLIQRIPAISGAATNPSVNNGGGFGESNVELRGLGAQRTLVLLNGRRIGILGNTTTSAVDINMVPLNLIERVEVLKEGAGAVYGSDAIAGVVNFITRKDWDGADVSVEYGKSSHDDGARRTASLSYGSTGDKLSILIGGNYNKQEGVSAGNRDFSKFALYLYQTSGGLPSVQRGGSSRTVQGRINLPTSMLATYGGCSSGSVTRKDGALGTNPTADYRCYVGANDSYNYQPLNLLVTPQERGSLFTLANYKINDSIEAYTEVLYNHTRSGFQIASLPLDARNDDLVIPANNYYNPFGIAFGGLSGINQNAQYRLEALGTRHSNTQTDQATATAGLKGEIFSSGWLWDFSAGMGRMQQDTNVSGYLLKSKVAATLGPSGLSAADYTKVVCGTPTPDPASPKGVSVPAANIISGCTPVNIFNLSGPGQAEALGAISTNYQQNYHYRSSDYALNVNGKLFDLPAGELSAAFGAEYRDLEGEFGTDVLTRGIAPLFLTCELAQETCTGDAYAQYDVKEIYGEFLIPLLKDMPGAKSLNLTAGIRYSDYSKETIGSSTNSEFKLEYRPISDLMVRASWAEVFRAPTIVDLSLAPSLSADTFTDPCTALTTTKLAANPNLARACQFVPTDGSFDQPNGQINGLLIGNDTLKPETGTVLTYGLVYDVSQVRGLSFTVDFWKYKIEDTITNLDPNFTADQCAATGQAQFCDLIFRFDSTTASPGEIVEIQRPTVNLGSLKTDGVDFGVKYSLRSTPAGSFNFSVDMTRINSYESIPAPGAAAIEVAGTYDRQFGNFAKWRGLLGVNWSYQGLQAQVSSRYIGKLQLLNPRGGTDTSPPLDIPSFVYVDFTLAYEMPTKTMVRFGALNLGDKMPPLLYQNNVTNANTNVETYDTIGRQWFVGISQRF